MKKALSLLGTSLLVAGALTVVPSSAQSQVTIDAIAEVAQQLTVNAGSDLDFGLVIPTFTKTVAVTDATAGTFDLSGGIGAEVQMDFTLPANLDNGGLLLPIGTWTGVHNAVNDPVAGATPFDPTAQAITNLSGAGLLYIFLGATVDATLQSNPGIYTGIISLTAAYTGN